MTNLRMYCLSLNPKHLDLIKELNYIPVGLGTSKFDINWLDDKFKKDISEKNSFYGEYTFHYKLWKNNLLEKDNKWIGFCQYRKFWSNEEIKEDNLDFSKFKDIVLSHIPDELDNFETIIGDELFINNFKLAKFLKKRFLKIISKPTLLFNKNKRNIKFHFDMMHGAGNLDKAISLLDFEDRSDFNYFVNTNVSFNPHNMFICKNFNILMKYYNSVLPWLERCEKIFGFKNLDGYGLKRIYGFLAERYASYWFKKYTRYYLMPIIFKDIGDFIYNDL